MKWFVRHVLTCNACQKLELDRWRWWASSRQLAASCFSVVKKAHLELGFGGHHVVELTSRTEDSSHPQMRGPHNKQRRSTACNLQFPPPLMVGLRADHITGIMLCCDFDHHRQLVSLRKTCRSTLPSRRCFGESLSAQRRVRDQLHHCVLFTNISTSFDEKIRVRAWEAFQSLRHSEGAELNDVNTHAPTVSSNTRDTSHAHRRFGK